MATKTTRRNGGDHALATAMAVLIQTLADTASDNAESRKEIAKIHQDLDIIKAVLARHETILERLPEAIREKIGFKN